MSEKLPYYVVARMDIDPCLAAACAVEAMDSTTDDQANSISNDGFQQRCEVGDEATLRQIIAEAVINGDYVSVGTNEEGQEAFVAIIGPSTGIGPILTAALTQEPKDER